MNLITASEGDFFKMHKLSMANWRIVDVDHFMRGNSFFSKSVTELDWHNDVESKIGTPDKREIQVKEIEMTNNVLELGDVYQTYLNIKEPRSNRGLENFKSKEQYEAEKKAAQEKAQQKQQQKKEAQVGATDAKQPEPNKKGEKKAGKGQDKNKQEQPTAEETSPKQ